MLSILDLLLLLLFALALSLLSLATLALLLLANGLQAGLVRRLRLALLAVFLLLQRAEAGLLGLALALFFFLRCALLPLLLVADRLQPRLLRRERFSVTVVAVLQDLGVNIALGLAGRQGVEEHAHLLDVRLHHHVDVLLRRRDARRLNERLQHRDEVLDRGGHGEVVRRVVE